MDAKLGGTWDDAAIFNLTHGATYRRSAPEATVVRIGLYGDALYVAFQAEQREPLIATQMSDGAGVLTGDAVMVHLWPNGLQGFAYWFATNVNGARDQYSSENSAYAPNWTAFARRTPHGYMAILRIPLSLMHVEKGASWRAQFHRIVAATNSNYVWELDPDQASFIDGRYGGRVLGIETAGEKTMRPRLQLYGLAALASARSGGSTSRVGADFSLPVTATTSVFGAVHPDFSNVEIDQQSIAPTEFARRFSEVRPFFTQASANFNQQSDMNAPMTTLYTPAIPSFRDGFGVEGRQGTVSFGAFDVSGSSRDDNALSLTATDSRQRLAFTYQRVGVDVTHVGSGFHDLVDAEGLSFVNPRGHVTVFANTAAETGSAIDGNATYRDAGTMYSTSTAMVGLTVLKMGSQFNPADGYANQPPGEAGIAGYALSASKQINFSPTARILDVAFGVNGDRFHGPNGGVNQADSSDQVRVDFKNLFTVSAMQGISWLQTCVPLTPARCLQSFLPYNGAGMSLGYSLNTAHASSISYMTGRYYHGTLSSWQRSASVPLSKRSALVLEADDNSYTSAVSGEPSSKQWLERVALNVQFSRAISLDFGARRIIGINQPYAFAPFGPTAEFTPAVCATSTNAWYPTANGCTVSNNVTNLSAALHFFQGDNELYVVYGDPNQIVTTHALFIKFVRYIGAGKGV